MPTPYTRLTTTTLTALASTTLGNLKPYQLEQVMEFLSKLNWKPKGSQSDVSGQPTITSILTSIGSNNP